MESIRLLFLSEKIRIYLPKARKDDNIIKLSFERDEKEKKDLSKLKRHDII